MMKNDTKVEVPLTLAARDLSAGDMAQLATAVGPHEYLDQLKYAASSAPLPTLLTPVACAHHDQLYILHHCSWGR